MSGLFFYLSSEKYVCTDVDRLDKAVLEAAEQGCIIFYTGAMGQFDSLFCSAVRKAKRSYPITLYYSRIKNTKLLIFI